MAETVDFQLRNVALELPTGESVRVIAAFRDDDEGKLTLVVDTKHDCGTVWDADRTRGGGMARFNSEPCRHIGRRVNARTWYGTTGCGKHWHCLECGGIVPDRDEEIEDEEDEQ